VKKALIVHTGGGLGDVLLSGPVVDTMAEAGYQVDFLARAGTSAAIAPHPNLKNLLVIEGKDPSGPIEMSRWARLLKKQNYGVSLLLWSTSRWAWTLYSAGIPKRVGQDSRLLYSFLFTHKVRIRSEHGDQTSHWTDILLDYPRELGLTPGEVKPTFPVTESGLAQAQHVIDTFDFGSQDGPLIGFHSGKGLPLSAERWPAAHFGLLARTLQHELKARLVLTGGPNEVDIVNQVGKSLEHPFLNLAGQTSVEELAAVQKILDVYVCPDSGPMHLAAAVGTPVVGIYALDEDFPERWAPFGTSCRKLRPPRPACPPGCTKPNCPDFKCYLKVQPEGVVEAVESLLQRNNNGPKAQQESPQTKRNRLPL
jgi:ADP-heptose:LPS heptosyltransferase